MRGRRGGGASTPLGATRVKWNGRSLGTSADGDRLYSSVSYGGVVYTLGDCVFLRQDTSGDAAGEDKREVCQRVMADVFKPVLMDSISWRQDSPAPSVLCSCGRHVG
jgi:hypothetical protein